MQKLKLDHTLISFLPILVFLPITYQIINDFHIGGLELFLDFVKAAFTPKINNQIINILIISLLIFGVKAALTNSRNKSNPPIWKSFMI